MDAATAAPCRHLHHRDDPPPECRRLGRSVARANTVVLQHPQHEDVWCVGFVEDVSDAGDELYISFHCDTLPARWIAAHRLYEHPLWHAGCGDRVHVALRANRHEPLVWEAAIVVDRTAVSAHPGALWHVETSVGRSRHLIHVLQLLLDQPVRTLGGASRRDGAYVRYRVPLPVPAAHADRVNAVDENRVYYEIRRARRDLQRTGDWCLNSGNGYSERFFFRLERNSALFVCWEYEERLDDRYHWTEQVLADCVQRCFECGALAVVLPIEADNNWLRPRDIGQDTQPCITDLPGEILRDVLDCVDVCSQAALRRASPVWEAVWTHFSPAAIILDQSRHVASVNHYDDMYRLAVLLRHTLRPAVRTLAVTRWRPGLRATHCFDRRPGSAERDVSVIGFVTRAVHSPPSGKLQRIVLHQCITNWEFRCYYFRPMRCLSPLLDVCHQLVLVDYVMNDFWGGFPLVPHDRPPRVPLALPLVRFDGARTDTVHFSTMRAAMEAAVPDVSADMRDCVASMLASWATLSPFYAQFLRLLLHYTEPKDPHSWTWTSIDFVPQEDEAQLQQLYQVPVRTYCKLTVYVLLALARHRVTGSL
ncbi:uncharacterized protein LOC129601782 [Paramacrobiotus metropolitanus]|uniref:uncharacterized protein LOC129601782 n=1 Tax=Paramacrobiotus metropolitanus TaxID=2943436 RepID=UPI002445D30D|nr:uncharacterized protein LOC129601782 [Paramacrobiotus metropolitanus]XP_055356646.1 uncharacterized protein LOC129601782 [Paramacrobiotus metropolitanus]XP_055356647.1 uncharacterized protein LOC129601782 [Paramacrobiotus metropolitanus]XP_055356648.1 uncharacterized protein LOC129601782 [Paramacrobiotus metropolitanus]